MSGQLNILNVRELTADADNFSGISTNVLNQGQAGRIWISTEAGVHIYDGSNCRNLFYGSTPSLSSLEGVTDIVHVDAATKYFIYNAKSEFVDRYNALTNKIDSIPLVVPSGAKLISVIAEKNQQEIWSIAQTETHLLFMALLDSSRTFKIEHAGIASIIKIVASKDGFWLLDDSLQLKQVLFGRKTLRKIAMPESVDKTSINSRMVLKEDSKGRLWLGLYGQPTILLLGVGAGHFEKFKSFDNTKNSYQLWEDGRGNLIFGFGEQYGYTQEYYFYGHDGTVENWGALEKYSNVCRQIFSKDFKDYLFCGTYRNTFLLKQNPYGVSSFLKDESVTGGSFGNSIIHGFAFINQEKILITTESDKWYFFNPRTNETKQTELDPKCTYDKLFVTDDYLWSKTCFGTGYHFYLTRFEPKNNKLKKYDLGFSLGSFFVDEKSIICVGALDGVFKMSRVEIENGHIDEVTIKPNFDVPKHTRIYFLHKYGGYYWMGSALGLHKIKLNEDGTASVRTTSLSLENNKVYEIINYDGGFLLSTIRGLLKFDVEKETFIRYDKTNLLSNDVACSVLESGNKLWVSTFSGLNVLNLKANTAGVLHKNDGLPDNEFNTGASFKAPSGKLYFGTANGFVIIDPVAFEKNGQDFRIGISNIPELLNDEKYSSSITSADSLSFVIKKSNALHFKFYSTDYYHQNTTKFYYTRNNEDKRNQILNKTLLLSDLPYGQNDIWIYAVSKYGFYEENPILIKVNVEPVFFKTWWFVLLNIIFLVGITYLLYFNWKRRREHQMELQKREVAQLELNVLQAQLNPHFIFNSLGAIQNYIHKSNHEKADKYIAEFAQLMRAFLESSKQKYLSISEEIDLLKRYTSMERMRFDDSFEVLFDVDPKIDLNNTIIPTFLLQPFVENAINHGLFHKEDKDKCLKIAFRRKGNGLLNIIIEDNGIGREEAKLIKQNSFRKHKSRAMTIIEEKALILKNYDNYILNIKIVDLKNDSGNPIGTRVNIELPELE